MMRSWCNWRNWLWAHSPACPDYPTTKVSSGNQLGTPRMRPLPSQADRSPMSSSPASHSSDTPLCRQTRRRVTAALTAVVAAALAFAGAAGGGAPAGTGTGPTIISASTPATVPDLVDHSEGLVAPAAGHTAAGADLAQARAGGHPRRGPY